MHKKVMAILAAALLLLGTASTCIAAVDDSELLPNGSFEEISGGTIAGGQFVQLSGVTLDTLSPAQDGFNSLLMPGSAGGFQISVAGINENSNYSLSFWTKTGVESSVKIVMYCYVSRNGGWYEYGEYCREAGIPYISNVEGVLEAYCGTAREAGDAVWEKNSYEIRLPSNVTNVVFYVSSNGKEDSLRAFDNFSLKKTANNLVLNGGSEESHSTVPGVYTPNQYRMASHWQVHPSEHYDGHYSYEAEEGNHYLVMEDSGNTDNQWRGLVLQQRVYLYEGIYKLSFKRRNFTSTVNIVTLTPEDSGVSTLGTGPHYMMNSTTWRITDGWEEHAMYFEVTALGTFTLKFGNVWFPGKFAIDDVTLLPVSETQAEYATDCTSYMDTANNIMDLKLNPADTVNYGESIYAHGVLLPRTVETESTKVINVLYKVDGQQKTVVDIQAQTVTAQDGRMKPFCTEAVEVPLRQGTETYVLKTLIWNAWMATAPYKVAVLQ